MADLKTNASHEKTVQGKGKAPAVNLNVPPEQVKYANMLLYGSWAGIAILAVSYILYITGIIKAYIPPSEMPMYWGMKAADYLHAANVPHGWGWFKMIGYGDFLNLFGVALLAGLTIVGYFFILLPSYLRKKDTIYTTIVIVEVLVLVLAASGILAVGAH